MIAILLVDYHMSPKAIGSMRLNEFNFFIKAISELHLERR